MAKLSILLCALDVEQIPAVVQDFDGPVSRKLA